MRPLDLKRLVVRLVDLPAFIERETGTHLSWSPDGRKCKCVCPFPSHSDRAPSFSIMKHDDGWGYKCFGCGATGTVVEFFKHYYGIADTTDAIQAICEKFEFEDELQLITEAVETFSVGTNDAEKTAAAHIMAANQCRLLLRECVGDRDAWRWVAKAYPALNEAVAARDHLMIMMIYDKARELFDQAAMVERAPQEVAR